MAGVKATIIFGRFVVLALIVMQLFFLASYPAYYEDEGGWYAVSVLFIPAAAMWWWISSNRADIFQVGVFWIVYIWLGVVPSIGIVFGRTGSIIGRRGFWNGSTLKLTLCITPLLHFLICHTRIATRDVHVGQISEWSAKAVINLFDGIELLGVILDENECSHEISMDFKNTLIAFTCISFLWWPIGMAFDHELADQDCDEAVRTSVSYSVQVLFDIIFLGLRLGLSLGYGKNASIFISKNIVFIIVYSKRIFNLFFGSDDSDVDPTENQQQAEISDSSMTSPPRPGDVENLPRFINVLGFNNPSVTPADPLEPSAPPPPYNPQHTSMSYVVS